MSVIWSGVTEEGAVVPVQVTDEGKVVAVGDGPQGDYLPTSGGNLTGDLTLGTDKITLDAAVGSAQFAGRVTSGDFVNSDADWTGGGITIYNDGIIYAGRSGNSNLWVGRQSGTADATSAIKADGSADFAGRLSTDQYYRSKNKTSQAGFIAYNDTGAARTDAALLISNNDSDSSKTVEINYDGSAKFAGDVSSSQGVDATGWKIFPSGSFYIRNDYGASPAAVIKIFKDGKSDSDSVAEIRNNGSAEFSGDVVIGSRGEKWLIRESNGVAMLVQQSREAVPMPGVSPVIPEKVRDIPSELDLIEMALNEVMEKLRMTPPAGWPVWDGSDNP